MAVALIVAAGRGERLGSGRPKALVSLAGRPMLEWSVDALRAVDAVERIVVALPAGARRRAPGDGRRCGRDVPLAVGARGAPGGRRRRPCDRPRRRPAAVPTGAVRAVAGRASVVRRRRGDRGGAGFGHDQGGRSRRRHNRPGRSTGRACGPSRPRRCSVARRSSERSATLRTSCWRPRPTTHGWWSGRAGPAPNRKPIWYCKPHPERFIAFGGVYDLTIYTNPKCD